MPLLVRILVVAAASISSCVFAAQCATKEYAQYKDDARQSFSRDMMGLSYCTYGRFAKSGREATLKLQKVVSDAERLEGMGRQVAEWKATISQNEQDADQCEREAQKIFDALKATKGAKLPTCD